MDRGRGAIDAYWANRTNRVTSPLVAARAGVGLVGASARSGLLHGADIGAGALVVAGIPVVGNVYNAAAALLDGSKATVRTAAYLQGDDDVTKKDLAYDWSMVVLDVAAAFVPPLGLLRPAGTVAYLASNALEARDDERRTAKLAEGEALAKDDAERAP